MKFLLIEDHPLFRLGVKELIRKRWPGVEVIEAETLGAGADALQQMRFDLVLLDLSLADASGFETASRALHFARDVPVLVVTSTAEAAIASRLLKLGVRGFVSKDLASGVLAEAIERVLAGGKYITPELADRLVDQLSSRTATSLPHEALSPQEYRVMLLIAEGKGPSEIAEAMHLAVKTIGTYRARILMKANWESNTELLKYCIQHKLTDIN